MALDKKRYLYNTHRQAFDAPGYDPNDPTHEVVTYSVSPEGFMVDEETGEVVGHVDERPLGGEGVGASDITEADAALILRIIRDKEAQLVGAVAERDALLASVKANTEPRINRLTRGIAFLRESNREALEAFAVAEVARANAGKPESKWVRSWKCAYGTLQLVADNVGKIVVRKGCEDLALDILQELAPSGLKTETTLADAEGLKARLGGEAAHYVRESLALDLAAMKPDERARLMDLAFNGEPVVGWEEAGGNLPEHEPYLYPVDGDEPVPLTEVFDLVRPGSSRMDIRTGAKGAK